MTLITKLRYFLFTLLIAMAFGFTGVAQADVTTSSNADNSAPEQSIQWDEDEDDEFDEDDLDWDEDDDDDYEDDEW